MRVRLLTSIACPLGTWTRDAVADLPEAMARDLIGVAAAVSLEPPETETTEARTLDETATLPRPRRRPRET